MIGDHKLVSTLTGRTGVQSGGKVLLLDTSQQMGKLSWGHSSLLLLKARPEAVKDAETASLEERQLNQ